MSKEELLALLKNKNILNHKNFRKFCWKKYFTSDIEEIFNEYSKNYRSSEEAWFCLCNNVEPYLCEVCGNLAKFTGSIKSKIKGYTITCENCSPNKAQSKLQKFSETINNRTEDERKQITIKRKATNLVRYGDENYTLYGSESFKQNLKTKYNDPNYNNREKCKKTNLDRYGVECNLMINATERSQKMWNEHHDELLNKRKQTTLNKYGVEHYVLSDEFKQKNKNTKIQKYGSIELAYKHILELSKKTKIQLYGDESFNNSNKTKETLINRQTKFEQENNCTKYIDLLKQYGQGWAFGLNLPIIYDGRFRYISNEYIDTIKQYSNELHNIKSVSKIESEIYEYVKSITKYRIYRNTRNIICTKDGDKRELDIYIPKLKFAIEFNGTYWHSNKFKDMYYHQEKTKLCYENGIRLLHIYEYEWYDNKDNIKDTILKIIRNPNICIHNSIPVIQYDEYILSEPNKHILENNDLILYDEGIFIKQDDRNID